MACHPERPVTFASLETCDKGHGRFETRRYHQSIALEWFADLGPNGKGSARWAWWKASVKPLARSPWNGAIIYRACHLTLICSRGRCEAIGVWKTPATGCLMSVVREDDSRTRTGHAAENLATLRRMAMNLLNRDKTKTARNQGQAAQRFLGSRIPAKTSGFLDASALRRAGSAPMTSTTFPPGPNNPVGILWAGLEPPRHRHPRQPRPRYHRPRRKPWLYPAFELGCRHFIHAGRERHRRHHPVNRKHLFCPLSKCEIAGTDPNGTKLS